MSGDSKNQAGRPPRLNLPFQPRRDDPGAWAYDHRRGLCVMVIAYLLGAIVFVSARISLGQKQVPAAFYIDLIDENKPQPPVERSVEMAQGDDFSQIRNRVSNQNAEQSEGLNSSLRDDRGTEAGRIYDEAAATQDRLRANRDSYEKGLQQERDINQTSRSSQTKSGSGDSKAKGRVTVEYSLNNPLRQLVNRVIPAYLCEGGGEVILNITVDRNGKVISAAAAKASSSVDQCMLDSALAAAKRSRFNVDGSAPERHQGTITYIFIPQ